MCSSTCFLLIVIVAPCLANAEAADDPRPLRDPSGRARWVAQCAALPLTELRKMAVRDHGLDPQLAALANHHAFPHLHFKGWALPHLWLWGGVNATRARYLAIPKAGSTSVRMALRTEYGHRGQSGLPWKPGAYDKGASKGAKYYDMNASFKGSSGSFKGANILHKALLNLNMMIQEGL